MKRKTSLNKSRELEKPFSTMVLLPLFVTLSLIDVVCMETLVKPRILTSPQIYRAQAGESIELECSVHNLGTMVLLWKEGPRVLFAGTMRVRRDERMELRGTNLILHEVEKSDEGEYDCEIETDRSDPISIRHSIEILLPPSVRSDPANGEVLVKQGSIVTVQCTATGNPSPSVTWTRLNQDKILGEEGVLQLSDVTHHHAGMYICTADNGVGNPADVHIQIKVLYKPEVWVEQDVVQGGLGEQATLVCRVQGYPIPDIRWYRGTMLLETDNHRYINSVGSRHSLVLYKLKEDDFTTYTCTAGNMLGTVSVNIRISGIPAVPTLMDRVHQEGSGNYRVSWFTTSFSTVQQYTMLYRKVLDTRNPDKIYPWTNILIPGVLSSPNNSRTTSDLVTAVPSHQASFLLNNLEDKSEYEVRISAKNEFGRSEMSDVMKFHTNTVETMPVESPRLDVSNSSSIPHFSILTTILLVVLQIYKIIFAPSVIPYHQSVKIMR